MCVTHNCHIINSVLFNQLDWYIYNLKVKNMFTREILYISPVIFIITLSIYLTYKNKSNIGKNRFKDSFVRNNLLKKESKKSNERN